MTPVLLVSSYAGLFPRLILDEAVATTAAGQYGEWKKEVERDVRETRDPLLHMIILVDLKSRPSMQRCSTLITSFISQQPPSSVSPSLHASCCSPGPQLPVLNSCRDKLYLGSNDGLPIIRELVGHSRRVTYNWLYPNRSFLIFTARIRFPENCRSTTLFRMTPDANTDQLRVRAKVLAILTIIIDRTIPPITSPLFTDNPSYPHPNSPISLQAQQPSIRPVTRIVISPFGLVDTSTKPQLKEPSLSHEGTVKNPTSQCHQSSIPIAPILPQFATPRIPDILNRKLSTSFSLRHSILVKTISLESHEGLALTPQVSDITPRSLSLTWFGAASTLQTIVSDSELLKWACSSATTTQDVQRETNEINVHRHTNQTSRCSLIIYMIANILPTLRPSRPEYDLPTLLVRNGSSSHPSRVVSLHDWMVPRGFSRLFRDAFGRTADRIAFGFLPQFLRLVEPSFAHNIQRFDRLDERPALDATSDQYARFTIIGGYNRSMNPSVRQDSVDYLDSTTSFAHPTRSYYYPSNFSSTNLHSLANGRRIVLIVGNAVLDTAEIGSIPTVTLRAQNELSQIESSTCTQHPLQFNPRISAYSSSSLVKFMVEIGAPCQHNLPHTLFPHTILPNPSRLDLQHLETPLTLVLGVLSCTRRREKLQYDEPGIPKPSTYPLLLLSIPPATLDPLTLHTRPIGPAWYHRFGNPRVTPRPKRLWLNDKEAVEHSVSSHHQWQSGMVGDDVSKQSMVYISYYPQSLPPSTSPGPRSKVVIQFPGAVIKKPPYFFTTMTIRTSQVGRLTFEGTTGRPLHNLIQQSPLTMLNMLDIM